ncbi:MAG TPA: oligopeptide/dipeptide ABC transporter ATP-binding protein [Geminicoccaceae bacterium]|nr:oligopeptide/dipeptide ABC transporter ATP-binding protein [Geminicoccaceae bacterium]
MSADATAVAAPSARPLLEVRGLVKHFDLRRGLRRLVQKPEGHTIRALDGMSLEIARGETLGVIGESGCGKTTLGRTVLRLQEPSAGEVLFDGQDLARLDPPALKAIRRRMQVIFQDPYASLNPRRTVEQIVGLGLQIHEAAGGPRLRERVAQLLVRVGLSPAHLGRYPHQFSGGQRQRIGIARALILEPDFVVCDEPVSALDVSIQAQIIALLRELKQELGLTYLFISHDLSVVAHVSDRVAVMYLGQVVELGEARALLREPAHPYTQALLAAVPRVDAAPRTARARLTSDLPSPVRPPPGCRFHTRCPHVMPVCREIVPAARRIAPGRSVACHLYPESRP